MTRLNWLISILFLICSITLTNAQNKKVVILDSIQANKIINQLIQGDIAKSELKIYKELDSLCVKRIKTLKTANFNLEKAYDERVLESDELKKSIQIQDKIIRKEKNKKNFYKIASIILAVLFVIK